MVKTKGKKITKAKTRKQTARALAKTARSHQPVMLAALGILTVLSLTSITLTQRYGPKTSNILGADDEAEKHAEEVTKEAEKHAEETKKEQEKQSSEQERTSSTEQSSERIEVPEPTERVEPAEASKSESDRTSENEIKKSSETEIETANGQKVKTKIEDDGTAKVEVENGGIKLKYRVENGKIVVAAEDETGKEVQMEQNKLGELGSSVDEQLNEDNVKVVPTDTNQVAVVANTIAATTAFPLSIDVKTKQLIVTTTSGRKVVTVLPDQAVQNLLATGIINKVASGSAGITASSQAPVTGVVELQTQNDKVVYEVSGTKTQNLFGFIPVDTQTTALVSADDGRLISQRRSLLANIIDFLSP